MRHVLNCLGVGALTAVMFAVLDPRPSWWTVGLAVAAVLYVNPPSPRR